MGFNSGFKGLKRFPATIVLGKEISITYSEFLYVDSVIQHAVRMSHIVICRLLAGQYFSTLSLKRHDFRREKLLNIKSVLDYL